MKDHSIVRIGFVGFGKQAESHAEYLRNHNLISIEAICGTRLVNRSDAERRLKNLGLSEVPIYFASTEYDPADISIVKQMLERHPNINALVISTPHSMHYHQVKFGLERGLHILVDKPLATTYEDAKSLVDLAQLRSLILVVSNQRRYEDAYSYVYRQLNSGSIGTIRSINAIISHERAWLHDWQANLALSGGGTLFSIGHHLIDTIVWLVQERVTEVNAYASFLERGEIEDYVDALIRFDKGSTAAITINDGAPDNSVYERIQIWGRAGNLAIDRFKPVYDREQPKVMHQLIDGTIFSTDFSASPTKKWAPAQNFVDAIIRGAPTISSGAQNLMTIQAIDALYKSLRTHNRVIIATDF